MLISAGIEGIEFQKISLGVVKVGLGINPFV